MDSFTNLPLTALASRLGSNKYNLAKEMSKNKSNLDVILRLDAEANEIMEEFVRRDSIIFNSPPMCALLLK